jgi:hypothetical protein
MDYLAQNIPSDATFDEKGRQNVESMTDRQLLEETVRWQRVTGDSIEAFIERIGSNPMFRSLAGRFGG